MEVKDMALTTQLIGLRGGLSLISKYADEIRKCNESKNCANALSSRSRADIYEEEKNCRRIEQEIEKCKLDLRNCEQDYINQKSKVNKMKNMLPEDVAKTTSNIKKPAHKLWYGSERWMISYVITYGLWVAFWIFALVFLSPNSRDIGSAILAQIFYGLIAAALLACITHMLFSFMYHRVDIKKYLKLCEEHKEKILKLEQNELKCKKEKLSDAAKKLEKIKSELSQAQEKLTNAENAYQNQNSSEAAVTSKNNEMIKIWSEKARLVNEQLRKTYGVVLMECDWQNIDLIIHYIETGRADSLKEALQQVDRQRQTDQIESAIRNASAAISSHIESAFSRMGSALSACFNMLGQNINASMTRNMSELQNTIQKNNKENKELNRQLLNQIKSQTSATEIQNALLSKANKSSDELLNDLRYNQQFWRK